MGVVSEDVEFVKTGEGYEKDVPYHQYCPVLAVQLPTVSVGSHY